MVELETVVLERGDCEFRSLRGAPRGEVDTKIVLSSFTSLISSVLKLAHDRHAAKTDAGVLLRKAHKISSTSRGDSVQYLLALLVDDGIRDFSLPSSRLKTCQNCGVSDEAPQDVPQSPRLHSATASRYMVYLFHHWLHLLDCILEFSIEIATRINIFFQ